GDSGGGGREPCARADAGRSREDQGVAGGLGAFPPGARLPPHPTRPVSAWQVLPLAGKSASSSERAICIASCNIYCRYGSCRYLGWGRVRAGSEWEDRLSERSEDRKR